jgi:hypothetical protein
MTCPGQGGVVTTAAQGLASPAVACPWRAAWGHVAWCRARQVTRLGRSADGWAAIAA